MLEFIENLRHTIKKLQNSTENLIIGGGVRDMEQYRFLMGRLEGYKFVQEAIDDLLDGNEDLS